MKKQMTLIAALAACVGGWLCVGQAKADENAKACDKSWRHTEEIGWGPATSECTGAYSAWGISSPYQTAKGSTKQSVDQVDGSQKKKSELLAAQGEALGQIIKPEATVTPLLREAMINAQEQAAQLQEQAETDPVAVVAAEEQ